VPEGANVEAGMAERIQGMVENELIQNASYTVVTRDQIKTLLSEQQIAQLDSAASDQKELKIEGVDGLIVGTITKAVSEEAHGPLKTLVLQTHRVGPIAKRGYVLADTHGRYVTVDLAASFRFIDAKSGRIYASANYSQSYDSRTAEIWRGREDIRYATPPEKLPPHSAKLEELVTAGAMEFLKQICYYQVVRKGVQLISRGDYSEKGYKFAVRNMIEEALAQFELAIQNEQPNDHALYDKGVMLEILGRYEEAYQSFKQAYTMQEDDLYLDAMQRMKEEKSFIPPADEPSEG
jgi:tetratricopeptide (TPR) repeat protein